LSGEVICDPNESFLGITGGVDYRRIRWFPLNNIRIHERYLRAAIEFLHIYFETFFGEGRR
jgi:hypothetical protein